MVDGAFADQRLVRPSAIIDETTGLPADYNSFAITYRPLILATAERLGIPPQDREDAAQVISLKFWQKNGLAMYDPERKTKFNTLLRNWAARFLLQERDKVIRSQRNYPVDPHEWVQLDLKSDPSQEPISDLFVEAWVDAAQEALIRAEKPHLIPLLRLCVLSAETGKAPSKQQIMDLVGCTANKASTLTKELRTVLTKAGLGVESLYD